MLAFIVPQALYKIVSNCIETGANPETITASEIHRGLVDQKLCLMYISNNLNNYHEIKYQKHLDKWIQIHDSYGSTTLEYV